MLKINKSLLHLNIGSNDIGNDGVISIAKSLKSNKTLLSLNIQSKF